MEDDKALLTLVKFFCNVRKENALAEKANTFLNSAIENKDNSA